MLPVPLNYAELLLFAAKCPVIHAVRIWYKQALSQSSMLGFRWYFYKLYKLGLDIKLVFLMTFIHNRP